MGSLNYLCNFEAEEYQEVIKATVLSKGLPEMSSKVQLDYRSRLSCTLEDQHSVPISGVREFFGASGKDCQPAVIHALNEISITRGNAEFMGRYDIYVND